MKITLNVSEENEATEFPWWLIIDPEQNLSKSKGSCQVIADMITGPFFSRKEAEDHLRSRRYAFGTNAVVYCHSGYWSKQYKEAIRNGVKDE